MLIFMFFSKKINNLSLFFQCLDISQNKMILKLSEFAGQKIWFEGCFQQILTFRVWSTRSNLKWCLAAFIWRSLQHRFSPCLPQNLIHFWQQFIFDKLLEVLCVDVLPQVLEISLGSSFLYEKEGIRTKIQDRQILKILTLSVLPIMVGHW